MSEDIQQNSNQDPQQDQNRPLFTIEKLYVKDLSIEVPGAPKVFLEQGQPQVNVQLRTSSENIEEGLYDVVLNVTVSATLPENKNMFLVEVAQAGVFQIRNVPQENIEPLIMIASPNILFPYAREAISDAITRAGFQPVLLAPVNFEALYAQQMKQQAETAAANQASEEKTVQ